MARRTAASEITLAVVERGTLERLVTAMTDVNAGSVIGKSMPRHRAIEFRAFLDEVESNVPKDLDVHVVMDNASSHKTEMIRRRFAKRPHWHMHFTPTSSSRINQVERFSAMLADKQIMKVSEGFYPLQFVKPENFCGAVDCNLDKWNFRRILAPLLKGMDPEFVHSTNSRNLRTQAFVDDSSNLELFNSFTM